MNRTRLTPTPRKPTTAAAPIIAKDGIAAPNISARATLTLPATTPLIVAVTTGSDEDGDRLNVLTRDTWSYVMSHCGSGIT